MKKNFALVLFLLIGHISWAQKNRIDSLLAKMDQATSLKSLAPIIDELLAIPKGDFALLKKGKQDLANAQASDNLIKQQWALAEISKAAFSLHDTPELLNASLLGIQVSRKLADNKLLGDFLHGAGLANVYQHETRKGISYTLMAANAHNAAGDIHAELNDYSNIESSYVDLKMTDSALFIANLEQGILKKINKTQPDYWNEYRIATGDLGEALASGGRPDSALVYYIKAYQAVKISKENVTDFPYLINNLAKTYLVLGKRDSAAKYGLESYGLASKTKLWEFTGDAASILAKVYEGSDDKKSAFYLKAQLAANDSINASDRAKQFQLITEKEQQRKDDLKTEKERYNARMRLYLVIGAATILLIIGIILWRNNKKQKHSNHLLSEQKEEISAQRDNLEHQNRELEIESALERVRTVAMGMSNADDMLEVCNTISRQLELLGLKEIRNVQTAIFSEERSTYMNYEHYARHDKNIITETGYANNEKHAEFADQMQKGYGQFFELHIPHAELKDWLAYQKTTNVFIDTHLENAASLNYYWYSLATVALGISTYVPLNEEEKTLFKRFLKVFELSYKRYLDIKQAEEQAREAQIQLALERVRARTMAMRRSEELAETVFVLFQQFKELGENPDQATIGIINEEERVIDYWVTMHGNQNNKVYKFSIDEPDVTRKIYNAWKAQKSSLVIDLSGKSLLDFMEYRAGMGGAPVNPDEKRRIINVAIFSKGLINVQSTVERSEESIRLLERFAQVFEQTYTRFLDLQKAEGQAREAQIEAALERTRTQSMIMQHSSELDDTLRVFHEQVLHLGIDSAFSFLWLPDEEKGRHIFWAAWAENDSKTFKSKAIDYPLDRNEPATAQCLVDWKGKEPVVSYYVPPEGVETYFAAWQELIDGVENLKPDHFSAGIYYVEAFMKYGCFGVMVETPLSDERKKILGRFSIEFERTYTRFLDLQKAEAQAREAQIEAALERVRSRTLAMQKSDELAETAAVLFKQMIGLGIEPNRLYIGIARDESTEIEFWVTDEDGSKVSNMFTGDANQNRSMKKMHDAWKAHQKSIVIDMRDDELTEYLHYLGEILRVPFKGGLTQKRRVTYISFFSNGFIGMASPDDQPQETINLLDRFAYVFNLTFARFNDLKIAELHAIQAEQDLIEIKAARLRAEDALTDLRAAQKQLVQSEKMASLGELTAGIAHEIQNPLNFVNNFSEVSAELIDEMTEELDKGDIEEVKAIAGDIRDNLEKIRHHGKRADGIVKGMLQHSRTSSGQKEPTDLNVLTDEYLRLSYHGLRAKDKSFNAELVTNFEKSLPKVSVVPQDIGRVILNLINNAFYATQQKQKTAGANYKPTVEVKTQVSGDHVLISVKDNGVGIPDNIKDKILQPFFTTKPTGEGTGLGLSLSYDIVVKSHGGNILINSTEGQGSEFIINLPLKS